MTTERNLYEPQRIHIGTPHANPVTLSRFDWRGPRAETGFGFWEVFVAAEARYTVTLQLDKKARAGEAYLRLGSLHVHRNLKGTDGTCTFESVTLPGGSGRLEAYVKAGRNTAGARFVTVERLDAYR